MPLELTLTSEEYVSLKGHRCPSCASVEIVGETFESGSGSASQRMRCSDCSAVWFDGYVLVGYEDLEHGPP